MDKGRTGQPCGSSELVPFQARGSGAQVSELRDPKCALLGKMQTYTGAPQLGAEGMQEGETNTL